MAASLRPGRGLNTGALADRGGGRTRGSFLQQPQMSSTNRVRQQAEALGDPFGIRRRKQPEPQAPTGGGGWTNTGTLQGLLDQLRSPGAPTPTSSSPSSPRPGAPAPTPAPAPAEPIELDVPLPTEYVPGDHPVYNPEMGGENLPGGGPAPTPELGPEVGPLGPDAIGLENLGAFLERFLAQPNPYDQEAIQSLRGELDRQRQQESQLGAAAINADAARRGAFYSTIPALGIAEQEARLGREAAVTDAVLISQAAEAQAQGMRDSIGSAMDFLREGRLTDESLTHLGLMAQELGMRGEPAMDQVLQLIAMFQGSGVDGIDPGIWQLLGSMFS